jgi:hypothetical protein
MMAAGPDEPRREDTQRRLPELAKVFSQQRKHRVAPMQVAAQLLEAALKRYDEEEGNG